jgi:hypothetical protein
LRRWAAWWTGTFPASPIWLEAKARFVPPPPIEAALPLSLFERIVRDMGSRSGLTDVTLFAARLLAPATTTSVADGSRFLRDVVPFPVPP